MRSFALVTVEPIFAQFAYYTLYYQTLSKVSSGWCLHEVDVMYLFTILYSIQWFFMIQMQWRQLDQYSFNIE